MANFNYTVYTEKLMNADLDLATADLRVMLLMSATTADTEKDALTLAGFTDYDEANGAGYARELLGSETVTRDDANNRTEFDAADTVFSGVSQGDTDIQAAMVYVHIDGTDANDYPAGYVDTGGFPFTANGGDITLQWNAEGIMQLQA